MCTRMLTLLERQWVYCELVPWVLQVTQNLLVTIKEYIFNKYDILDFHHFME